MIDTTELNVIDVYIIRRNGHDLPTIESRNYHKSLFVQDEHFIYTIFLLLFFV